MNERTGIRLALLEQAIQSFGENGNPTDMDIIRRAETFEDWVTRKTKTDADSPKE